MDEATGAGQSDPVSGTSGDRDRYVRIRQSDPEPQQWKDPRNGRSRK